MLGHECFPVEPVPGEACFWVVDGAEGVVGDVAPVAPDCVLVVELVVVLGAAAAPDIPAAAPAVAIAPATIVAPSILDMDMVDLLIGFDCLWESWSFPAVTAPVGVPERSPGGFCEFCGRRMALEGRGEPSWRAAEIGLFGSEAAFSSIQPPH